MAESLWAERMLLGAFLFVLWLAPLSVASALTGRMLGVIPLSTVCSLEVSAYAFACLSHRLTLPLSCVAAVTSGALVHLLACTFLTRLAGRGQQALGLASLGLYTATIATSGLIFGSETSVALRSSLAGSAGKSALIEIGLLATLLWLLHRRYSRGTIGLMIECIEDDPLKCLIRGLPVDTVRREVSLVSGGLSAVSAIGLVSTLGVSPTSPIEYWMLTAGLYIVPGQVQVFLAVAICLVAETLTLATAYFLGSEWIPACLFVIALIVSYCSPIPRSNLSMNRSPRQ